MYVSSFCYVQVLKHQYSETYTQLIGVYLLPSVDCKAGSTMEWQHGSTWEQKELKMGFGLSKLTYTQTSPLHLKNNTFIMPVVCSILPVTIPQPPPPLSSSNSQDNSSPSAQGIENCLNRPCPRGRGWGK